MADDNEKSADKDKSDDKGGGTFKLDLHGVPTLYTWIRQNFLTFAMISVSLLILYGAYQFIEGYAKSFGVSMVTQHAELKRAVTSYTALDSLISKPLMRFRASRVTLFRLHDNEKDLSRMAFFFASVANIVAAPGVEIDLASISNLPASLFAPVLSDLIDKKPVYLHIKEMTTGALKELEAKRGVKTALFIPITDLNDALIAFLEVDWLSDEDVPVDDDRKLMMASLQSDCSKISGYFSLSKLTDK